ncbi:methyl-accepting chemotaxis protein [Paeniroseomonas aquatica]|uniref:methyl-accepting chemotaxis protein n=1 Tax=Paeniroseomonas aquatica TaxID=373043 RepID=UPI0036174F8C
MAEATGFVRAALVQGIDALAAVAEQAGQMVAVLDGVGAEVAGAEECVVRIDTINKQARFVALNAAIEAQRAEGAGGTFKVIANELKELAMETDRTSRLVRQRINAVGRGLRGRMPSCRASPAPTARPRPPPVPGWRRSWPAWRRRTTSSPPCWPRR